AWYSILDGEWPKVGAGFEAWLGEANQTADGQAKTLTECRG
ncbi:GNAT family N-acetyltransferase, partial [Yersinia enterocolitica]|nr:GNAT family N-acetyltransferase [Yersinia enterocolitica]